MSWQSIDGEELGSLYVGAKQLVRHVYRQRDRPLRPFGYSIMIEVSFNVNQPLTAFINVAEGWADAPGADVVEHS